jgi:signal peptidase II
VPSTIALTLAALVVLALDQGSKHWIVTHLALHDSFPLFGFMDIHHVRNTGAAFSLLPGGGWLFMSVAAVVLLGLLLSWRRVQQVDRLTATALGLIAGGTLGNLIDRLRFAYVVDFLDLRWWPVFNVADSAICVGVALLMWKIVRPGAEPHDDTVESPPPLSET